MELLEKVFLVQAMWWACGMSAAGVWLTGKKIWWSPWIGVFAQVFWVASGVYLQQYALLVTAGLFGALGVRNGLLWWRDRP